MLQPRFEVMPQELRTRRRWVTHYKKCPYDPTVLNRKASVTDPASWGTFQQAEAAYIEGARDGVGFVLDGDGVVGIDLDDVVANGKPNPVAMRLLHDIGCRYIELSPSGSGLHAWGFGPGIGGRRGVVEGIRVELYSAKRYLTCTGHVLQAGPLVPLPGFEAVADSLRPGVGPTRTPQKTTEVPQTAADVPQTTAKSHLLLSSVGCIATTPQFEGERNRCLFELARRAKGKWPEATREDRRQLVLEWHAVHFEVIGTKAPTVSLDDFERAWQAVRHVPGQTLAAALSGISLNAPVPDHLRAIGYRSLDGKLWQICAALQASAGDAPFFLSSRKAAELMGHTDHSDAAAMLRTFVADGVLKLMFKGAGRKASRYQLAQKQ